MLSELEYDPVFIWPWGQKVGEWVEHKVGGSQRKRIWSKFTKLREVSSRQTAGSRGKGYGIALAISCMGLEYLVTSLVTRSVCSLWVRSSPRRAVARWDGAEASKSAWKTKANMLRKSQGL